MGAARPLAVAVVFAVLVLTSDGEASASTWAVHLAAASKGEAQAQTLPAPSPSAACTSALTKTIKVTWTSAAHANYTVYESNTTVGGTYTSVATGITTGTWTSATLSNGHYWFKVQGFIGTNWASGQSAATGSTTIQTGALTCVQP